MLQETILYFSFFPTSGILEELFLEMSIYLEDQIRRPSYRLRALKKTLGISHFAVSYLHFEVCNE